MRTKTFLYFLFFLLLTSLVSAVSNYSLCDVNARNLPENIPCIVTTEIQTSCDVMNMTVYNITNSLYSVSMSNYSIKCGGVFNISSPGEYFFNYTDTTRIDSLTVEADKMIIAMIILLPVLLGLFFLVGAVTLNEKHWQIKIFLFLLGLISFFASFHAGVLALIKYYDFPEMQDFLGLTTFWTGIVFFVLTSYFIILFLIWVVHYMAEKRQEKLEY